MEELTAAVGVFDGVHLGHQSLVHEVCAKAIATSTVPAIFTFSSHPLSVINPAKNPRLLTPPHLKECLLKEAGAKIVVTLEFTPAFMMLTATEFMTYLKKDYNVANLIIGFNHRFGHGREQYFDDYVRIGHEIGIDVVQAGEETIDGMDMPVSSSSIRGALSSGDILNANTMLGRPYSLTGIVGRGKQIGRTIGFPTANLQPDYPWQLIPKPGVYACMATVEGEFWPGMVNIGSRPTIGNGLNQTIESNIIGFDNDIYNKAITLDFIDRIRDEKKFPDIYSLQNQLKEDRIFTLKILSPQ